MVFCQSKKLKKLTIFTNVSRRVFENGNHAEMFSLENIFFVG